MAQGDMSFYVWHDLWRVRHSLTWFCFCNIFHNTLCAKRAQRWPWQLLFDCKFWGNFTFYFAQFHCATESNPACFSYYDIDPGCNDILYFLLSCSIYPVTMWITSKFDPEQPSLHPFLWCSGSFTTTLELSSSAWFLSHYWSPYLSNLVFCSSPAQTWHCGHLSILRWVWLPLDCRPKSWLHFLCMRLIWNTALIHLSPSKATSNCSIREHSLFLTFLQGVKSLPVGSSKIDRHCLHVHKKLVVFFLLCLWEWMFTFEISIFLLFWYLVLVQMCKTLIKTRFLFKVYIQEMKIICMLRKYWHSSETREWRHVPY